MWAKYKNKNKSQQKFNDQHVFLDDGQREIDNEAEQINIA